MICLVAHHFTIHGNLYLNENIFVQRFSLIFAPLGKMCYVVFMVISSYFLSNANVKSKRFWKVWMEVLFYNILMNYENIGALLVVSSKSLEVVDRKLLADNLDIFIQLILICYLSDDYHKKNFLYDLIKKYKNIEIILDNITKKSSCSILKQRCQNFIRELKKENV